MISLCAQSFSEMMPVKRDVGVLSVQLHMISLCAQSFSEMMPRKRDVAVLSVLFYMHSLCVQPFCEITALTDVQEGIIVRCIQRLYELLRDVRNAARIIGDPVLFRKMEEAMSIIKRDIVFAASLYTQ